MKWVYTKGYCKMSRIEDVFQGGDVLFSIPTKRAIAIRSQFLKKFPTVYCYIDPYIHSFIGFIDTNILGIKISYTYGVCPDALFQVSRDLKTQAFRQYVEAHPKYDPKYVYSSADPFNFTRYVLRVKRACKAWAEWTVCAEKHVGSIHVLLDHVDMQRIFSPDQEDTFFRAELKKLYKLFRADRDAFKERIFFWKEGERVCAPWDDVNYRCLWASYEEHLQYKKEMTVEQHTEIRNKIYASNPSGEVTSTLLSQNGLFSSREKRFVESRCANEERCHQFTIPRSKL